MTVSQSVCKVKVKYFGAIAGVVKKRSEEILLPKDDATIDKVFSVLAAEHGRKFEEMISCGYRTSPIVTVFVNGESVSSEADLARYVAEGSEVEVSLVNQMSGG